VTPHCLVHKQLVAPVGNTQQCRLEEEKIKRLGLLVTAQGAESAVSLVTVLPEVRFYVFACTLPSPGGGGAGGCRLAHAHIHCIRHSHLLLCCVSPSVLCTIGQVVLVTGSGPAGCLLCCSLSCQGSRRHWWSRCTPRWPCTNLKWRSAAWHCWKQASGGCNTA
jgi:hypothetical protein